MLNSVPPPRVYTCVSVCPSLLSLSLCICRSVRHSVILSESLCCISPGSSMLFDVISFSVCVCRLNELRKCKQKPDTVSTDLRRCSVRRCLRLSRDSRGQTQSFSLCLCVWPSLTVFLSLSSLPSPSLSLAFSLERLFWARINRQYNNASDTTQIGSAQQELSLQTERYASIKRAWQSDSIHRMHRGMHAAARWPSPSHSDRPSCSFVSLSLCLSVSDAGGSSWALCTVVRIAAAYSLCCFC